MESERREQPFGSTHGYFALGLTHLRQGAIEEATTALERGVGIAQSRLISFFHPLLSAHLAETRRLSGRVDEGLSLLTNAQREIGGSGRRSSGWIQELLAEMYLAAAVRQTRPSQRRPPSMPAVAAVTGVRRPGFYGYWAHRRSRK